MRRKKKKKSARAQRVRERGGKPPKRQCSFLKATPGGETHWSKNVEHAQQVSICRLGTVLPSVFMQQECLFA